MSRSSFSKAYEETANLESMEMTFTIEDADLDKLNDVLKDINVKECPWFEVQDKHGNKAKYYRESQWIPCSERLPKKEERSYWICLDGGGQCQCRWTNDMYGFGANKYSKWVWHIMDKPQYSKVVAWMPLPEPYGGDKE